MNTKNVIAGKYANLERELGERRTQVPYHQLKTGIIETFEIGRIISGGRNPHLVMAETLGLSKKAENELGGLYSSFLMPLQAGLEMTRVVMMTGPMLREVPATQDEKIEAKKKGVMEHREELGKKFVDKVLPDLFNLVKDTVNVKSVIVYPLLMATVNSWRQDDFEFAEMIIAAIKASEPDKAIRTLIEQLDIPVTQEQLKRN